MYLWIKALHVISIISWMVGLLYLPRLYVYHAMVGKNSAQAQTLALMERRLLQMIMTPAMISTFVFGFWLIALNPGLFSEGWFQAKLGMILLMVICHGKFARIRREFENGSATHGDRYYRIWNEAPTLLMVIIVILVIVKPF
jgi:putative membrane protein